jgi:formylglycine-generating enzyme required for sulfatase activity
MRLFIKNFFLSAVVFICLMFCSCSDKDTSITVKTYHVTNVTSTSGVIRGTVSAVSADIIDAGIVYSTSINLPRITNSKYRSITDDASITDNTFADFTCKIADLDSTLTYRFRVYASTADSTYYGITYSFKPTNISMDLVSVTGGTFKMGATAEQESFALDNEKPEHQVQVSSFLIGKYEVTNAQFVKFLNSRVVKVDASNQGYCMTTSGVTKVLIINYLKGPYYDNDSLKWRVDEKYADLPVVDITWYGANEYCLWAGGRLPTESEWEYAARGGDKSQNYIYSGSDTPSLVAWYGISGNNQSISPVQPCGGKAANELGIYDMSGNVWEWVADWYDTYSSISQIDPKGLTDDEASDANVIDKVRRGGGWANTNETTLRVSYRATCAPKVASGSTGFRFAKDI